MAVSEEKRVLALRERAAREDSFGLEVKIERIPESAFREGGKTGKFEWEQRGEFLESLERGFGGRSVGERETAALKRCIFLRRKEQAGRKRIRR